MKKVLSIILTFGLILNLTACGEARPSASEQTTTTENTAAPAESTAATSTEKAEPEAQAVMYSGYCAQQYEILTHPHDSEYFTSFTDDWMWISENEHITDELKISEECKEMQLLYCFLEDGHIGAVRYKYIFETSEIAQQAYDEMFDNPYGLTNYELYYPACFDNVVYVSYGVNASDTKDKKIRHMENDSTLKKYGKGLYTTVMAGGAVWTKYILSSFDGVVNDGGEAPQTPAVSAPENDSPSDVPSESDTSQNAASNGWETYRGEFTDDYGEIQGVTVWLATQDGININFMINYYIGDPENVMADVNYGTEKADGNTLTIANADMGNLDWDAEGNAVVEADGYITIVFTDSTLTLTTPFATYNCTLIGG